MRREEIKLSLYADDMSLCIENPKDSKQKLLELLNKFSKVAGYKMNIQKSAAFFYTSNEILEKEYQNGFEHVQKCSLSTDFGEGLDHEGMLDFFKCFFCIH